MDYVSWVKRNFPKMHNFDEEKLLIKIEEVKSDNELFREAVKTLGALLIVLPLNVYLYAADLVSFSSPLYWFIVGTSVLVGGLISLHFEQKSIKWQLAKCFRTHQTTKPPTA